MARTNRYVTVKGRRFRVLIEDGRPRIVYERVVANKGHPFLEAVAFKTRWHSMLHQTPKRGLIAEVLRNIEKDHENV